MGHCFHCQSVTTNPKFCSRSCSVSFHNRNTPKRARLRKCIGCDTKVLSSRKYCAICLENRPRIWQSTTEANRHYVRESRKRMKLRAVEYRGGCCHLCEYSRCLAALEFHHLDSSQKDFQLSYAMSNTWSWNRIQEELDKCVLLCCRCHREVHAGLVTIT